MRYEVEKIVDKKISAGKPLYLVKWKGYDSSENTWEPLKHLDKCGTVLKDFEQQHSNKKCFLNK
jgi:hypothetical protein